MDDRGQIMLLASVVICICLILLAMYLVSIENAENPEKAWRGEEAMENIIWAQEIGFEDFARATGNYSWDRRQDLEADFKARTGPLIDGITRKMRGHGIAVSFAYNETFAAEMAAGNDEAEVSGAGGILVKKSGDDARVSGCAYDLSMTDGSAHYALSRAVYWG
jgi:hypothetical protein